MLCQPEDKSGIVTTPGQEMAVLIHKACGQVCAKAEYPGRRKPPEGTLFKLVNFLTYQEFQIFHEVR
jgi:hypothetical protein